MLVSQQIASSMMDASYIFVKAKRSVTISINEAGVGVEVSRGLLLGVCEGDDDDKNLYVTTVII